MPPRLNELYRPGDPVEIFFADAPETGWHAGEVVAAQPPGVWVRTADGAHWFVTNGRHIRLLGSAPGLSSR